MADNFINFIQREAVRQNKFDKHFLFQVQELALFEVNELPEVGFLKPTF
jgi:hypothetical protein